MTLKRNSASNKMWGQKECASFSLLALTFGAHRGILAALDLPLHKLPPLLPSFLPTCPLPALCF